MLQAARGNGEQPPGLGEKLLFFGRVREKTRPEAEAVAMGQLRARSQLRWRLRIQPKLLKIPAGLLQVLDRFRGGERIGGGLLTLHQVEPAKEPGGEGCL